FALVVLFIIAFALAVGIQIKSRHDSEVRDILSAQANAASLIAERINANLALATGAASGAAELARTTSVSGADAPSLANAAAHAPAVRTAAVLSQSGAVLAITDHTQANIALAAFRAAGQSGIWSGAPDVGDLPTAPVLVRRVGDQTIVTILDPQRLMPELSA